MGHAEGGNRRQQVLATCRLKSAFVLAHFEHVFNLLTARDETNIFRVGSLQTSLL